MSYGLTCHCDVCSQRDICDDMKKIRAAIQEIHMNPHSGSGDLELHCVNLKKHPESFPIYMNFGEAIYQAWQGKKIARNGWNGKNMWVVIMPSLYLPPHSKQEPGPKVNDRTAKHIGEDTSLNSQPYFAMWNAQGNWQPGWLPSQADALACDWTIVE